LQVFFESHPVYDQTQGSGAVFFLLYGYDSNITTSSGFLKIFLEPAVQGRFFDFLENHDIFQFKIGCLNCPNTGNNSHSWHMDFHINKLSLLLPLINTEKLSFPYVFAIYPTTATV
jgi:hypothetical protein